MNKNLKNRPNFEDFKDGKSPEECREELEKSVEWFEAFEKDIREQLAHLEKQNQDHMIPLGFMVIKLKEILGETL